MIIKAKWVGSSNAYWTSGNVYTALAVDPTVAVLKDDAGNFTQGSIWTDPSWLLMSVTEGSSTQLYP